MEPFSVELWIAIFRELGSAEWLILSRTCKLFQIMAQQELYRFVSLPKWSGATHFARSLKNKPELASLARSLTCEFDGPLPSPTQNSSIFRKLSSFINLRDLSVTNFHIEAEFSSALRSLDHLKSLRFHRCSVVPVFRESRDYPVPGNLLDVYMSLPQSINGWSAMVPGHLRTLTIVGADRPSTKTVLLNLTWGGRNSTLTDFTLDGFISPNINMFLKSSPNIRRISIPPVYNPSMDAFNSLPEDCMPLLEKFSGPPELCRVFVKGRPVHSVTLKVSDNTPHDILLSLRHSTVPITNLMLSFKRDYSKIRGLRKVSLGTFLIHAPTSLEILAWANHTEERYLTSCLPLLNRLVKLRALQGTVAFCNFEKTVDACSKASASLREIVFVAIGGQNHDVKWVKSDDGNWSHYTLEQSGSPLHRTYSYPLEWLLL